MTITEIILIGVGIFGYLGILGMVMMSARIINGLERRDKLNKPMPNYPLDSGV